MSAFDPLIREAGVNLADSICRRHKDGATRLALLEARPAGINSYTFGALNFLSDKLATILDDSGMNPRERAAVLLPQSAAQAIAQLGILKAGGVVVFVPATVTGTQLKPFLQETRSRILIIDGSIKDAPDALPPLLKRVLVVRDGPGDAMGGHQIEFWRAVYQAPSDFKCVLLDPVEEALLFYRDRPSGGRESISYTHGDLLANLRAVEKSDGPPAEVLAWANSDWSMARVVTEMIYPAWHNGSAVLARAPATPDEVKAWAIAFSPMPLTAFDFDE